MAARACSSSPAALLSRDASPAAPSSSIARLGSRRARVGGLRDPEAVGWRVRTVVFRDPCATRCRIGRKAGGVVRFVVAELPEEEDVRISHRTERRKQKTGLWNAASCRRIAACATAVLTNTLCASALAAVEASTENSNDNSTVMFLIVCVAEAIALTGAAVGGVLARQRKVELEKINAQLRQINVNLRRQSRMESYAPNLTYAPVGAGRISQVQTDPVREELIQTLKAGKRRLREQKPAFAQGEFQKALTLAQQLKDTAEEKKAARGLGASCQRQGKYKDAIKYHAMVLRISKMTGETSGDTEAYGAIADSYTELGDLETAGKYYDQYIERLENDDTS